MRKTMYKKSREKQDNKDIQDASGGNSTFDKLEEFTKGIGDVPKMIADIFSFCPWCLEVWLLPCASMILIVVKFIRGRCCMKYIKCLYAYY